MDTNEIQQLADELEHLNYEEASIELLKSKIERLLAAHLHSNFILQPGPERLYRAVLYKPDTKHVDRLKYPPANRVKDLGRANCVEQSIFYCSSKPQTTFFERDAKPGEVLVVSEWRVIKPLLIHLLGYTEYNFQQAQSTRPLPGAELDLPHHGIPSRTNDFLHELFLKPAKNAKQVYKLTAAIAQYFYSFFDASRKITVDGGIAYPSVAMHANDENFAIPAKLADECLELVHAKVHPILDYKPYSGDSKTSFYYDFDFLFIADTFENGQINWRQPTGEEKLAQRILCEKTIPKRIYDHQLRRFRNV